MAWMRSIVSYTGWEEAMPSSLERKRQQKKRFRARNIARGLTGEGKTRLIPYKGHPSDCPCYDCLFPVSIEDRHPIVYKLGLR